MQVVADFISRDLIGAGWFLSGFIQSQLIVDVSRVERRQRKKTGYRKARSGLTISRRDLETRTRTTARTITEHHSDYMTSKYSGIRPERFFGVDGHVGNTPLIRLRRLSELTDCEILGKAEFMNPAGSVKDRAAYGIISDAEAAGRLKPGATIVEGTAGNTGIGLAVIGRARGYRTVIVIPNNQSPEKMQLLCTLGAEVKAVPEKPYKDPENYNHIARRLAEERGWFWANQFDNTANRDAHYHSTGPGLPMVIWIRTTVILLQKGSVRAASQRTSKASKSIELIAFRTRVA